MSKSYLYGQLNSSAASSSSTDYTGASTTTATVTVDNTSRIIYVDTKINVKEVEEEIAAARVEIAAANEQYKEIIEKYSTFKADIAALYAADTELNSKISTVSQSLSEVDARLSQEIIDTKAELREDIDKVIVKVEETIQPKLDELSTGLSAANTRIDKVSSDVTEVAADLQAVKVEVQELVKTEIAKLKADIEQLKVDVQTIIDTEIAKLKQDIAAVQATVAEVDQKVTAEATRAKAAEAEKQDKLISGTNIKTINSTSLLGAGNIDIQTAVWGNITGDINKQADLIEAIAKGGSKEYTDQKFAEAKVSIDTKCDHLYYDQFGTIDPELTEVWYLMSWVDGVEQIVAGPYTLGGGGGGGSITEMTSELKSFPETVSRSATECNIVFNWTSVKGTSKTPTGSGTIYIYVNGTLEMTVGNAPQGDNTIDILDAIKDYTESKVTVNIKVADAYNNYEQKSGTIQFVEINLTSTFDADTIFKAPFTYACTPVGIGLSKTLNYFVDDVLIGQVENVKTSGEQVSFLIDKGADGEALKHGAHSLKVYFTCLISGQTVMSNVLKYNFMYEITGDTTPMITSSFDDSVVQTQYISFTIPYKVYSPGKTYSEVELSVNGEVVSKLPSVKPETQYWEYRASEYGNYQMVISCGEQHKILNVVVKEAEIHIDPVTDKLALYLTAIGRSNAESEEDRKKWQYKYKDAQGEEQVIEATLYNFNFSSDGWLQDSEGNTVLRVAGDAQVEIPYKIFEEDFKDTGKTIEFEFATSSVMDYNTEIISCFYERESQSVGLSITAQEAMFKSIATEGVSSQYKEEEHIRIAFTVEKKNENRLMFMYINGVLCNAIQYPSDDSFRQPVPANITIGSSEATTDIYCIRVYDNNLTMKQIVNNWIADTQSGELKQTRYLRNNIFSTETGEITPETLPDTLPYMIWDIDPLPQYKGDKRPGGSRYVEKLNSERNFTAKNAQFNVQGTSSSVYPVKNIRIKYKQGKNDDGTLWDTFEWYDDEGNTIKKYGIRDDSIQDNYFTHKVDFASSEGVNNVELTRLYNDVAKEWKYLTPPQKVDNDIRVGIDGIPIASFWKDVNGNITFNSKANFNNDKANEAVYGFEGHWDDETKPLEDRIWVGDESWEVTQNNVRVALFQDPVTPENFSEGFEIRFPDEDGYDKLDKLGPMTAWVSSTDPLQATDEPLAEPKQYTYTTVIRSEDGSYITKEVTSPVFTTDSADYRQIKFKAELKDWFDVNSTIFYYVFTHMFLLVDSRAKNCFPTYFASRTEGDGGDRWFWLPYDMDTAIGINNEGKLRFSFNLEDTDKDEKGANVFNGQDSVMWCNLRRTFLAEISQMYYGLRNYSAARSVNFSFDDVENRFYEHQSKWPENLFNKDSEIKYIDTLVEAGQDYLEMLQGDKAQQRKWWLYNRFKYMDAKYLAGEARSNVLIFRAYGKSDMEITPFADTYINVSFANSSDAYASVRATKGITYHISNPLSGEVTDQETHIYGVDQLKSLGDLSGFKPDTVQADKAIHLQELKIGDGADTYNNPNLTSINVSKNVQLQYLDVRHCSNLAQTVDLSSCSNIETVWCEGSSILGVTLPDAGILKSLHVPNTITKLIIKNHPLLTDLVIENIAGLSLSELWIENMKNCSYDVMQLVKGMEEGTQVRLIDIDQKYNSIEEVEELYDVLDKLKGTDAQGRVTEKAQLNGKIHINAIITYADWKRIADRYTDVTITATAIQCTVNFMKTEKAAETPEIYETQFVEKGKAAVRPTVDPVKPSSERYNYEFVEWADDFSQIESDLNIYPVYQESTRYYKVDFDTRTTKVTVPSQYIEYEGKVVEPTKPKITGATFLGWFDEQGNAYQFLTTPVTKAFTLYARWSSDVGPTVTITKLAFDTFEYKLEDDVAIKGYAITTSPQEPTTWTEITPTSEFTGTYQVEYDATYYVWAKDENEHTSASNIIAYAIVKEEGEGTEIVVTYAGNPVENYCLQDLTLNVSYTADSHYEGVKFYFNEEEVTKVPFEVKNLDKDCTFTTTSTPKVYTVHFENGEYGEQPPDQQVAYGRLVEAPENQFVQQRIIQGWYTSPTFEQETAWEFAANKVEGDTVLYANWILYMLPSVITVAIDTIKTVTCNFDQRTPNGVTVNWGDGSADSQSSVYGVVSLSHTYDVAGNYDIKVTCTSGSHYLGGGTQAKPVIVPASVIKSIDFAWNMPYTSQYALYGAVNLKSVNISQYMVEIAAGTFQGCTGLTQVVLPKTLTKIGAQAFYGCSGLSGIFQIPDAVTSIGTQAFLNCKKLIGIRIPEAIKGIGEAAFKGCSGITTFDIPYYVTYLPNSMLADCTSLSYIIIPDTVTTMGTNVFQGCSNLSSVTIMNEDLVAGEYCFDQCLKLQTGGPFGDGNTYNFNYTWKTKIPDKLFEASVGGSALEQFTLADTIETIGVGAFANTTLKTINFPASLKTISERAFFQCYLLTCNNGTVELPDGVETIGANAFYYCSGLTHMIIPSTVTYIGNTAFASCVGLVTVYMHNTVSTNKIETYTTAWFYGCNPANLKMIYIPVAIKEKVNYQYGAYWNYYTSRLTLPYSASLDPVPET